MKKHNPLQIPIKKYLSQYKQLKRLYTDIEYEIVLLRNISNKKKALCIRKYCEQQSEIYQEIKQLQIFSIINQHKFINRLIGYAVNHLEITKKNNYKVCLNIVFQFGEVNLEQFVRKNNQSQHKKQSLTFVKYLLGQILDSLISLQNIKNIELSYFYLNHQLITVSNYGEVNQQIKFCYLPFNFLKEYFIRNLNFHHEIYSSKELRQINRYKKKSSQVFQHIYVKEVIVESQRETQNYNCNQQTFQKIGLCLLKCVYFLCQDIQINQISFQLYTMNEKFDIDFNWSLITAFLAECQNHKDYYSLAKTISFMIKQNHQQRSFKQYSQLIKQIKHRSLKKSSRQYRSSLQKQTGSRIDIVENQLKLFGEPSRSIYEENKIPFQSLQQIQQILRDKLIYEIRYDDNTTYRGELINGQRQGLGIYYFTQNEIYAGQWKNNQMCGKGLYLFATKQRYSGQIRGQIKHGYGIYQYKNGNKYQGEWVNDLKQGYGTLSCATTKQVYKGFFKQNFKQGKGNIYYPNKQKFQGSFNKGFKQGNGCVYGKDGRIYLKAKWKLDQIDGPVQIFMFNNDYYIGEVSNNKKNGKGIYKFADGTIYEGGFVDDSRTGNCFIRFVNGDTYEGQVLNGKFQGQGKYYYKNSSLLYDGSWKEGLEDGQGKYIYKKQIIVETTQKQRQLLAYNIQKQINI